MGVFFVKSEWGMGLLPTTVKHDWPLLIATGDAPQVEVGSLPPLTVTINYSYIAKQN